MARVKRGFKRRRRVKKIRDQAEGFTLGRKNLFRRMAETVDRSLVYAYKGRKMKKRDFRSLWITRLSAAAKQNETSYHRLISSLKKANVQLDRKVLSEIAISDPKGFSALVTQVK